MKTEHACIIMRGTPSLLGGDYSDSLPAAFTSSNRPKSRRPFSMPPLRIPPHIVRTDIAPRNPTVHHFGEHRTSAVYSSPPSFLRGRELTLTTRSSAPRPRVAASGRRGRSRPTQKTSGARSPPPSGPCPVASVPRILGVESDGRNWPVPPRKQKSTGAYVRRGGVHPPPRTGRIASLRHRRRRRRRRVREVPRTDAVVHN